MSDVSEWRDETLWQNIHTGFFRDAARRGWLQEHSRRADAGGDYGSRYLAWREKHLDENGKFVWPSVMGGLFTNPKALCATCGEPATFAKTPMLDSEPGPTTYLCETHAPPRLS